MARRPLRCALCHTPGPSWCHFGPQGGPPRALAACPVGPKGSRCGPGHSGHRPCLAAYPAWATSGPRQRCFFGQCSSPVHTLANACATKNVTIGQRSAPIGPTIGPGPLATVTRFDKPLPITTTNIIHKEGVFCVANLVPFFFPVPSAGKNTTFGHPVSHTRCAVPGGRYPRTPRPKIPHPNNTTSTPPAFPVYYHSNWRALCFWPPQAPAQVQPWLRPGQAPRP